MVMKSWMVFLAAAFMLPLTALAHGPSGQKVMKDSDTGAELPHHLVILKDGGSILEKLRESNDADMKLDYKMVDGAESTIAVSNYRTVMQVKAGPSTGESTLTWTARFYNAANTMEAPPGKDNPAANAAINSYYDAGITGLKKMLEK
jgi:mxaD protein